MAKWPIHVLIFAAGLIVSGAMLVGFFVWLGYVVGASAPHTISQADVDAFEAGRLANLHSVEFNYWRSIHPDIPIHIRFPDVAFPDRRIFDDARHVLAGDSLMLQWPQKLWVTTTSGSSSFPVSNTISYGSAPGGYQTICTPAIPNSSWVYQSP